MRIFPPTVEIGSNEGFSSQKDIFQRAEFGKGIANLLEVSEDPLIVMLDAPWGAGKTTFIKMLAGHLRNEGFPVVYFDAFKNDYVDDGFLAIAGEVIRLSNELKKNKTAEYKQFLISAARAGGSLLRLGTKIGVKAATLGAIDAADLAGLKSVAEDVAKEASTKADQYVESLLKLQSREHETFEGVKVALSKLANSLNKNPPKGDAGASNNKPLVFIVDELDRCRPTFALELLEKIKHIFSIQHVHFLLSTHIEQLENTVRFSYGAEVDARVYLQKFYNVLLHFPESGAYRTERNIPKYFRYLASIMQMKEEDWILVQNVAEAKSFSLRTIERIISCVAIARSFTPDNYLWLSPIISGLAILKVADRNMFNRALSGRITVDELKIAFAIEHWLHDSHGGDWMVQWWIYCLAEKESDYPDLDWSSFRSSLFRYNIGERRDIVRFMAGHMDRLKLPDA